MKIKFFLLGLIVLISCMTPAFAETFSLSDQRFIDTGQNANWYYTAIHKVDKTIYVGVDKIDRGAIGFGESVGGVTNMFGRMWLIPAFKHPSNSKWYLCPVTGVDNVHLVSDLGNGWWFNVSDSALTCYQYDNTSLTGTADMEVQFDLITGEDAGTKISANVSVSGVSPSDTGFAFFFVPEDPASYRYVYINDAWYDLAGIEGQVPIQKIFNFYDAEQRAVGHLFDWNDMLDDGNRFSAIMTLGQKGFLVGTYGYGASNTITVDPLYQVDYSPEPAEHLINGTVAVDSDTDFESHPSITVGLSDLSDATTYLTREYLSIYGMPLRYSFALDETSGSNVYDSSANQLVGDVFGNTDLSVAGKINTGAYFDGDNDYIYINDTMDLIDVASGEDVLHCLFFNSTETGVTLADTLNELGTNQNWVLEISGAGKISYSIRRGGVTGALTTAGTYNDGVLHSVCGYTYDPANASNGEMYIYVDGVIDATSLNSPKGVQTIQEIFIGVDSGLGNDYTGLVDEFCSISSPSFANVSEIVAEYNTNGCESLLDTTKGIGINSKWSHTYDDNYDWFLRIRKTSSGSSTVYVYPYINMTDINQSMSVSSVLSGTGWFNIDVSSLMDYQLNDVGLNYTSLRFFSSEPSNFSEVLLRSEVNDTQIPTIVNCQINDTSLGFLDVARMMCNVTDDSDVSQVLGLLDSVNESFSMNDDWWFYDFVCSELGDKGTHSWTHVYAEDIVNNWNDTVVDFNFTCDFSFNSNLDVIHDDEVEFNHETTIIANYTSSGSLIAGASVNVTIDGTPYSMSENASYYYYVWNVTDYGVLHNLSVTANHDDYDYQDENFTILSTAVETELNATYPANIDIVGDYRIIINYTTGDAHISNATVEICYESSPLECFNCTEHLDGYYYFDFEYDGTEGGIVYFNVTASKDPYETLQMNFTITLFNAYLGIQFWDNLNMTTHHFNEFLWVYAKPHCSLYDQIVYLGLFSTCEDTYYHAKYEDGLANLSLWSSNTYDLWVVDGSVTWECDTCAPNITRFDHWEKFDEVNITASGVYISDYLWNTSAFGQQPIFDIPEWNFWLSVIGIVILLAVVIAVAYFTKNGVAVFLAMILSYILLKLFGILTGAIFFGLF